LYCIVLYSSSATTAATANAGPLTEAQCTKLGRLLESPEYRKGNHIKWGELSAATGNLPIYLLREQYEVFRREKTLVLSRKLNKSRKEAIQKTLTARKKKTGLSADEWRQLKELAKSPKYRVRHAVEWKKVAAKMKRDASLLSEAYQIILAQERIDRQKRDEEEDIDEEEDSEDVAGPASSSSSSSSSSALSTSSRAAKSASSAGASSVGSKRSRPKSSSASKGGSAAKKQKVEQAH
jgi:hypothetical protein